MARLTNEQVDALNYFADAYLNTGCDEAEATDHAEFMLCKFMGDAEQLRFAAVPYLDM